ncbi:MAG: NUDIX hydrolase [Gammaproteobacteria bacterium]|nr:NUDIX hydrolase [Gammaproteobacteria bacterium]
MADIGTETLQNQQEQNQQKHKNDMYGDVDNPAAIEDAPPAVPAATVVLLRDTGLGPEVLMLRKNSRIAFGGMWVFPGGRIDPEDYPEDGNKDIAARNAAAREAQEEAGVELDPQDFVWFAHWTPPPSTPKRFATWFFAARAGEDAISIDGGEIEDHRWIRPGDALAKHAEGEIDLVPPTWVTLYHLSQRQSVAAVLGHFAGREARVYQTRVVKRADGVRVAMWTGDAGYDDWNADLSGPRHRLNMPAGGFSFENTVVDY